MDIYRPMTNEEAANILENVFLRWVRPGRGNGKTYLLLRYTEALAKAITLLRNTPDN